MKPFRVCFGIKGWQVSIGSVGGKVKLFRVRNFNPMIHVILSNL